MKEVADFGSVIEYEQIECFMGALSLIEEGLVIFFDAPDQVLLLTRARKFTHGGYTLQLLGMLSL